MRISGCRIANTGSRGRVGTGHDVRKYSEVMNITIWYLILCCYCSSFHECIQDRWRQPSLTRHLPPATSSCHCRKPFLFPWIPVPLVPPQTPCLSAISSLVSCSISPTPGSDVPSQIRFLPAHMPSWLPWSVSSSADLVPWVSSRHLWSVCHRVVPVGAAGRSGPNLKIQVVGTFKIKVSIIR